MCNYPILKAYYSLLSKLQLKIVIKAKDVLLQPLVSPKALSKTNALKLS